MIESSFSFIKDSYPELFIFGHLAERLIGIDPSSSLSKSRLCAEKITKLIIEFEQLDYIEDTQFDKIDKLYADSYLPDLIKDILHAIRKSGNKAAHSGIGDNNEAALVLSKLFDLLKWFYQTYEDVDLGDIAYVLPNTTSDSQEIDLLTKQLEGLQAQIQNYETKIRELNTSGARKGRKQRSENLAKKIELNEKETRVLLIDPKLRNAGWECNTERLNYKKNHTLPQKGRNMAIAEWRCGNLWADYALFVDTTLYGVIEAKRFSSAISTNLHQSKIYSQNSDTIHDIQLLGEWEQHKVPFLFSTNGREYLEQIKTESGIWFSDVRNSRKMPVPLRNWYSPNGLMELYKRDIDQINAHLKSSEIDYLQDKTGLSLYDFQVNAIKAIEKKIISDPTQRRALLVMATGTGKTRTAIGLSYRLVKSNRFRRILFLTDRRILAKQAADDFKDKKVENLNTFAEIYQIGDLKDLLPKSETRIHFATVQGMVKRLFHSEIKDEVNLQPLSIDTYDCIIVDEAHRGYNLDKELDEDDLYFRDQEDYVSQYKKVIDYFDAYVIGLTATPALHTTQIFGMPVFTYSYREAVIDGYLVDHEPPYNIKTELSENGIVWEKGERPKAYNPEDNNIEELSELEDELHIEVEQFNKQVITESFNRTVIKELVRHLDPDGDEKTLIFAARDSHADMIVNLLFEEFAAIGVDVHQDAIKKITGKSTYDPGALTLHFKNERFPNIVVTVDLLTTGVDVPPITNLVFMRRVRSRILFEQMMGRATRKCDTFKKDFFRVFDAVRVYEALEHFTQMQVVSNPVFTFEELIEEFGSITNEERKVRQIEQIVAKLQRRKKDITGDRLDQFVRLSEGKSPEELIENLKNDTAAESEQKIKQFAELWHFMDERIYCPKSILISEHEDMLLEVARGYGKATKPQDYIESFKEFILQNRETIAALNIVCTRPSELSRESLKDLKLILDQNGYNEVSLKTAWKNATNQEIAADIIAFIRTLALDVSLVSPQQRVKNAIDKVRQMHNWNVVQNNWINRFEDQLVAESVLTKEDLNKSPFIEDGGYELINKKFNYKLDEVIQMINTYLYSA